MTRQEYYDLLCKCASDGTFPSINEQTDQCLYRSEDGKQRCAVGILLSEQDYYSVEEDMAPAYFPTNLLEKILPVGMTVENLEDVQLCHDSWAWKIRDGIPWDATTFVNSLNELPFFKECVHE